MDQKIIIEIEIREGSASQARSEDGWNLLQYPQQVYHDLHPLFIRSELKSDRPVWIRITERRDAQRIVAPQ